MYNNPLVFPAYGQDVVGSNGLVMAASFTSSGDIGGGNLAGVTGVFNANGYFPNVLSSITFDTTTLPALANIDTTGFTLCMEMSADLFRGDFTTVVAGIEYYFRLIAGTEAYIIHVDGAARARCRALNHAGTSLNTDYDFAGFGASGDMLPVHFVGGNGYMRMYVNGYIWLDAEWNPSSGTYLVLGAGTQNGTSRPGLESGSIRNVMFYNRIMSVPNIPIVIALLGDSQGNQGTYPNVAGNAEIEAAAVDGDAEAGFTTGSATLKETALAPALHGRLALTNKNPSANRIQHWSVGGLGVIHSGAATVAGLLSERVAQMTSAYPAPDMIIHFIGTNDLADVSALPTAQITDNTWRNAFQVEIDNLKAKGVSKQVVINIPSRTDATYLSISDREYRLNTMNAQMLELTDVNKVVDLFTDLGGHSISSQYLSDGVHLSGQGHTKLVSDLLFPAVTSLI